MKAVLFLCTSSSVFGFFNGIVRHARVASTVAVVNDPTDSSDWPAWPGDRTPMSNLARYIEKMDAAWGRGKYRSEVWLDDVNPKNSWHLNYAPSKEEREASQQGYDFQDPKSWFEV